MTDDTPALRRGRKWLILTGLTAVLIATAAGYIGYSLFHAQPRAVLDVVTVIISKETTYVTGPLRQDGYVDYLAALNERWRQGVTPDNNAAVLFWKAVGPDEIPKSDRPQFFRILSIPPPVEQGDYFVELRPYLGRREEAANASGARTPEEEEQNALAHLDAAMTRPWSTEEFPVLARWLTVNQKPLGLLVAAFKRPRRYDPLMWDNEDPTIGIQPLFLYSERRAEEALAARAMLRLREGNVDAAWEDLLTCHRLARIRDHCPMTVDGLAAAGADGLACAADRTLLHSVRLTAAQATKMQQDLGKLPALPSLVDVFEVGERFYYLDGMLRWARNGQRLREYLRRDKNFDEMVKPLVDLGGEAVVDWNELLRIGNAYFDGMVDAFRQRTRVERTAAISRIGNHVRELAKGEERPESSGLPNGERLRRAMSRRLGGWFAALTIPAYSYDADVADRATMKFAFVRLGFAVAAYRAEHGSYPARLAELVPKFVADVPKDIFLDSDLHYTREGDGYLLYSVGVNGKDDGGKGPETHGFGEVCDGDYDDIVLRVPAPTMEKRKQVLEVEGAGGAGTLYQPRKKEGSQRAVFESQCFVY
jgi:hypothetical protein